MDPHQPPVDETTLQAYYARDQERDRLASGVGRVEFLRTVEVAARVLPAPPATVADIGGGPGRYTDHLLAQGHHVVHRDLVADHVAQVRARHQPDAPGGGQPDAPGGGDRLDAAVGDACDLDLGDASVDAVLFLGPLYHLVDRADRLRALREAARVVRPGGAVVAAAISRWSARLDGVLVNRLDAEHPQIDGVMAEAERTGVLRPLFESSFNAYFHHPTELADEVTESGLELDALVGVEGVTFALHDIDERLDDPEDRERLMATLRATESAPELLGVSPHLLAVARRPDQ